MRRSRAIEITLVPDATVPGAQSIGKVPRGPANQGSGTPIVPPPSPPPTGDTDYGVLWRTAKEGYQRNLAGNPITDYDLGGTNYSFRQIKSSLYPGAVGDDNDIQWEVPVPVDMDTSDPQLQVRLHFLVPINPPIIVPASARGVGGGVGRLVRGGRATTLQARGVGGGALRGTSGRSRLFTPRGVGGGASRSNPTTIPSAPFAGYNYWLKADLNSSVLHTTGTPANNNDYVQYWLDQSGNGHDTDNPSVGGTNPIYHTNVQNGKNIIRFATSSSEILFGNYNPSGQITIFAVIATGAYDSSGFGSNLIFSTRQFRSDQPAGGVCLFVANSGLVVDIQTGLGSVGTNPDGCAGAFCTLPDHNFHLLEINIGASATNGWLDGTLVFTDNSHGAITAGRGIVLGGGKLTSETDYFDFWNGDWAEIIGYPSSLSSTNQAITRSYLKNKWATP